MPARSAARWAARVGLAAPATPANQLRPVGSRSATSRTFANRAAVASSAPAIERSEVPATSSCGHAPSASASGRLGVVTASAMISANAARSPLDDQRESSKSPRPSDRSARRSVVARTPRCAAASVGGIGSSDGSRHTGVPSLAMSISVPISGVMIRSIVSAWCATARLWRAASGSSVSLGRYDHIRAPRPSRCSPGDDNAR